MLSALPMAGTAYAVLGADAPGIVIPAQKDAPVFKVPHHAPAGATLSDEGTLNVVTSETYTLLNAFREHADDLANVIRLVVEGPVDSQHAATIASRCPNVQELDLRLVTGLTTITGFRNHSSIRKVWLPEQDLLEVGDDAFISCNNLQTVSLSECTKRIGESAFYYTPISEINLEYVERIEDQAFYVAIKQGQLTQLTLPAIKYLGNATFTSQPITSAVLGENLEKVGYMAFYGTSLTEITFPSNVKVIGNKVLSGSTVSKIEFGGNLEAFTSTVFSEMTNLKEIICNQLVPMDNMGFPQEVLKNAVVYVPAFTYEAHASSPAWIYAKNVLPMTGDITKANIRGKLTINSGSGLGGESAMILNMSSNKNEAAHLTIGSEAEFSLNSFVLATPFGTPTSTGNYLDSDNSYHPFDSTTMVVEGDVSACEAKIDFKFCQNEWQFFSLPFNVRIEDIVFGDDVLWAIREYSGLNRSTRLGDTWLNLTDGSLLEAGKGYILHCSTGGTTSYARPWLDFSFPAAGGCGNLFSATDVETRLGLYPSEFPHNANWNLIGNPYPCWLDIRSVDFQAPLTTWNGKNYTVYSPIDDEYALKPFEAFFVQSTSPDFWEGGDVITFHPEGRRHSNEALPNRAPQRRARVMDGERSIFDITISSGDLSDRTRLVFNPVALLEYETLRDASKFMSSDKGMPQVWINENNVAMAIDERPFNNGKATLGMKIANGGTHSIGLDARRAPNWLVTLHDNELGTTQNLSLGQYEFNAEPGNYPDRFTISFKSALTSVSCMEEESHIMVDGNIVRITMPQAAETAVFSIDGRLISRHTGTQYEISLEKGIYTVIAGRTVKKVIIH